MTQQTATSPFSSLKKSILSGLLLGALAGCPSSDPRSAPADLVGTWDLKVHLSPSSTSRTLPYALEVALRPQVIATDAGYAWSLVTSKSDSAGSGAGDDACCSTIVLVQQESLDGGASLTFPPQIFRVAKGTPMALGAVGMPLQPYRATSDWEVRILGQSGVPLKDNTNTWSFPSVEGEVREDLGGGPVNDPIRYQLSFDLTR